MGADPSSSLDENIASLVTDIAMGSGMRSPSSILGQLGQGEQGQIVRGGKGHGQGWQGQSMRAVRLSWWLWAPLLPEMTLRHWYLPRGLAACPR